MRIAVLLNGFLRGWSLNRESIITTLFKNISISNVDFFLHVYRQNLFEVQSGKDDEVITDEIIKELFKGLNVVKVLIEDRTSQFIEDKIVAPSLKYSNLPNFTHQHSESADPKAISIPLGSRIYDQLRTISLAKDLLVEYQRETQTQYSYVVKLRYDLYAHTSINWTILNQTDVFVERGTTSGWPCDCMAVGSWRNMIDGYCNRFELLDEIVDDPLATMCAHYSIRKVLSLRGIEINCNPICVCSVRRNDDLFYVPMVCGLRDLQETRKLLNV